MVNSIEVGLVKVVRTLSMSKGELDEYNTPGIQELFGIPYPRRVLYFRTSYLALVFELSSMNARSVWLAAVAIG